MRIVRARPRLFACIVVGAAIGFVLPAHWHLITRILLAWNTALVFYGAVILAMTMRATAESIRRKANDLDEGRFVILVGSVLAALASVVAIVAQLGIAKDMHDLSKALHIGLAASTIVLSWFFIHLTFALHYAHEFYFASDEDGDGTLDLRGGLKFPGTKEPRYIDFLYYAYTIGVAAQTADVETTSRGMRTVTLLHAIVSFFFNTTILALTINIAAGLI